MLLRGSKGYAAMPSELVNPMFAMYLMSTTGELLEEALELEMRLEARSRAKQAAKAKVITIRERT
jgi:hypothetical protein